MIRWFARTFILTLILSAFPLGNASAFYEDESGENYAGLFLSLGGLYLKNPEDSLLYEGSEDRSIVGVGRLIIGSRTEGGAEIDANVVLGFSWDSFDRESGENGKGGVERNPLLEKTLSKEKDFISKGGVDHLSIRKSFGIADLKIGRQPINFATTFYFTPNDFFAPFSAEEFFRTYKPGVDSARVDLRLGSFTQLTVAGVLGYGSDETGGYNDYPDGERSSLVARFATVFGNFEWVFLGGDVTRTRVIGGSLQGELFGWLGIRTEGHYSMPEEDGVDPFSEISFGVERRFENSLDLRAEYFYHELGYSSSMEYGSPRPESRAPGIYLGQRYLAAGAGYQFSPLLTGQFLYMANLADTSSLLSSYFLYSVSDEGELSLGISLPQGKKASGLVMESEYGAYPASVNLELRLYI